MILSYSPLKMWLIATCLFVLDGLLITTYLTQPDFLKVEAISWDFRIAELRSLDQPVADTYKVVPIMYLLQTYFPESSSAATTVPPVVQVPWYGSPVNPSTEHGAVL